MTTRKRDLKLYLPVYAILVVVFIVSAIIDDNFLSWENQVNLFARLTPLIFAGLAQTLVILSGGIDLSVGSIISLTNVVAASMPFADTPLNILLWLTVPCLVGFAAGLSNGVLVSYGRFPPVIATLAMNAVWQGVALFVRHEPGGNVSLGAAMAITARLAGIVPVPLLIFLLSILLMHVILTRTRFGRSVYAVGANARIAFEAGIPVRRVTLLVYAGSGFICGLCGVYLSGWMYSADPLVGGPYILDSVAASVIGGNSLFLGRGGVLGLIGGAYIFRLLNNILNLIGVSVFYQYIAKGVILLCAVALTSSSLSTYAERIVDFVRSRLLRSSRGGDVI
jgi:ribose transport system permease protein